MAVREVLHKMYGKSQMFLNKNGSTILTCVGAAGIVATTVLAIKATTKAHELLDQAEEEKGEELTNVEVIKVVSPVYIPTVVTGVTTIACVFGANVLNKRKQASLISAYALLDTSFKEYKNKVIKLYGEAADEEVREEIVKDHYNNEYKNNAKGEELLFYDQFSGRYFESTMADVIKAEYNLNRQMTLNSGAYLNEFYEFLGIDTIKSGNELGWSKGILESMYWAEWVEFDHEKVTMDDGLECYIIVMRYEPVIDFAYY